VKLEYLRVDLGVDRLSAPVLGAPGVIVFIDRIPHEFDTVRVGFDYRFGEEHARSNNTGSNEAGCRMARSS
jgi:hypothetical protein